MSNVMKRIFALLTPADIILIVVLFIATGFSYSLVKGVQTEGNYVIISVGNLDVAQYPLSQERESIVLSGVKGEAKLQIKEGRVRMVEAPCPNKICVGQGWKSKSGELIACVPNRVVIRIAGGVTDGGEVDGISY